MKFLLCFLIVAQIFAQDFVRNLPDEKIVTLITPERFPNMDAVIVLKEQSFVIEDNTVFLKGYEITGLSTKYTRVQIVKLFNEAAVKRYSNFEYSYNEYYGDELPNVFEVRARVMKPDGDILIMPQEQVHREISRESSSGTPLARKVICKVPEVAIGDILQIEYTLLRNLAKSSSGIFYYNSYDFALYSNLYITLPFKWEHQYFNFPAERIGAPQVVQISETYGAGETYFWNMQNLNPVPREPFSRPFSDRSLMTAFVVKREFDRDEEDWSYLARNFYEDYLDEDAVSTEQIALLGINRDAIIRPAGMDFAQQLYTAIRDSLTLKSFSALRPLSEDIDSIFDKKEGDASDLSYIMYKILTQNGCDARIALIRDRREGIFEKTVPTLVWFDRLGVIVRAAGKEVIFDFDQCVPHAYMMPWYLEGVTLLVVNQDGYQFKDIAWSRKSGKNMMFEEHRLHFSEDMKATDSIKFVYRGAPAEKLRLQLYDKQKSAVNDRIRSIAAASCLDKVEVAQINDFINRAEIRIDASGQATSQPETVESRFVFKLKNHLLKDFRDKIYSSVRRSNYFFEGPFTIQVKWVIQPPAGYVLDKDYRGKMFPRVDKVSARLGYIQNGEQLIVTASVNFASPYISYKFHPALVGLLDQVISESDKDIIYKKM